MSEPTETDCSCWSEKNAKLEAKGFRISDSCAVLRISLTTLSGAYGLPLQRADGSKLKKGDPVMIEMNHCPFCGKKYTKE
jgi:hypothetical protein